MKSDRVFAIYALSLITAVCGLLAATVVAGVAAAPSFAFLFEHTVLGLLIRGAYKSFGGANYVYDYLQFCGLIGTSEHAAPPAGAHPSAA
jgi:hypothetical protein